MVHSSFAIRGGAERYVRDLTAALISRGHQVRIFARPSEHAEPGDVPVPARASARLGKLGLHLGDLADPTGLTPATLREFAPDAVHVHNWQGLGALPVARIAAVWPTFHTVHDYALADPNNALGNRGHSAVLDTALESRARWLTGRFRGLTLLWPAERTREIEERNAPATRRLRGVVVPLAVPAEEPAHTFGPGRPDTFLFLGALTAHKGLDVLLDAWDRAAVPGTLLVAGDGPLRGRLHGRRSVEALGFLDAAGKRAAMERAGWLVFPSQWAENFPLSCVEALRAGRPIVASEVARPPMASDAALLTFRDSGELADRLRLAATMRAEDYATTAGAAAADGRLLDWDAHVDAVLHEYKETSRT